MQSNLAEVVTSTNLVWVIDKDIHYVDLIPSKADVYRINVRRHELSNVSKPADLPYYKISFGLIGNRRHFKNLETAKEEAVKFAVRLLLEALCSI